MEIIYRLVYDLSMTLILISSSNDTIYMSADNKTIARDMLTDEELNVGAIDKIFMINDDVSVGVSGTRIPKPQYIVDRIRELYPQLRMSDIEKMLPSAISKIMDSIGYGDYEIGMAFIGLSNGQPLLSILSGDSNTEIEYNEVDIRYVKSFSIGTYSYVGKPIIHDDDNIEAVRKSHDKVFQQAQKINDQIGEISAMIKVSPDSTDVFKFK